MQSLPELDEAGLRPAEIDAIHGVERSLAGQRHDRSLVQMATGARKTFAAVTESYRLLKHGGFTRILFLVDRNNLGDQTLREFRDYTTPDDGRRFTELYNLDKLTGAGVVGSKVVISTIHGCTRAARSGGRQRRRPGNWRVRTRQAGRDRLQGLMPIPFS